MTTTTHNDLDYETFKARYEAALNIYVGWNSIEAQRSALATLSDLADANPGHEAHYDSTIA